MATLVLAACSALTLRLWQVQVLEASTFVSRLPSQNEIRVRIPPVRGEIRDRNGVLLAENRSTFAIEFYLPEMVRAYRTRHGRVPMLAYEGHVHDMAKMLHEPDIVAIVEADVIPRLRELGLPAIYDPVELARHFRTDAEVPFRFVENADFGIVSRFSEHDIGLPGVRIALEPTRHYVYGAFAAHVLGYVGDPLELSAEPDARQFDFYAPNVEGKAQMEKTLDPALRGAPGVRLMQRNLKGVIDREVAVESPQPGRTVYLTLDARIQSITERALRSVGRAGAVVVDPNNGAVLAMASVPSFDPNTFVPSIPPTQWAALTKDPADPLVNRAVSAFPPGSTFKAVTALAGLKQGLSKAAFTCTGGVSYGNHYFQCWNPHGHGRLTLSDALKVSCNAFFYQYGNAAGIDAIDAVGTQLGLGQSAGLGLSGEQPGILPGPAWLKEHSPTERWSSAQTANVAIGQGYDLVSPLQLATAYAAVANRGTAYYPRLVEKITGPEETSLDGTISSIETGPRIRANLTDAGISPGDIDLVRQGLWKVVNEDGGTAGRARLPGGILAGKTGTAQAQLHGHKDTIAWFVGFAPFDHPRYVICVMVQGGAHGGSVAAPIAGRILQETLAMDEGSYEPVLAVLPPAQHPDPFRMIESVSLGDTSAQVASRDDTAKKSTVATSTPGNRPRKSSTASAQGRSPSIPKSFGAQPSPLPTQAHRNFFQWLFHPRATS